MLPVGLIPQKHTLRCLCLAFTFCVDRLLLVNACQRCLAKDLAGFPLCSDHVCLWVKAKHAFTEKQHLIRGVFGCSGSFASLWVVLFYCRFLSFNPFGKHFNPSSSSCFGLFSFCTMCTRSTPYPVPSPENKIRTTLYDCFSKNQQTYFNNMGGASDIVEYINLRNMKQSRIKLLFVIIFIREQLFSPKPGLTLEGLRLSPAQAPGGCGGCGGRLLPTRISGVGLISVDFLGKIFPLQIYSHI